MNPFVSIIITTYNRPVEVKRAIASAIRQSYQHYEVLVIEDGTDSGVDQWIATNNYQQVAYYKNPRNVGLAASRNKGIQLAKGEFVTFLDDDDVLAENYLQRKVETFAALDEADRQQVGLILSGVEIRNPQELVIGSYIRDIHGSMTGLLRKGFIKTISSSLFVKKALLEQEGFDEKLKSSIDHDLFMSLARQQQHVITVPEALVINYEYPSKSSMMKDPTTRINGIKQFLEKWKPFLLEELGNQQGTRFIDSYFSRVVTFFAVSQLEANRPGNWFRCLGEIKRYNKHTSISDYKYFFKLSFKTYIKKFLPGKILHNRNVKRLSIG